MKTRITVLFIGVVSAAFFVAGCGIFEDLFGPEEESCEKHNTAEVAFENKSSSSTTYDVYWDGSKKATIAPGAKSSTYTEAAGAHTVGFKIAGTNTAACSTATPTLSECSSNTFSCSY